MHPYDGDSDRYPRSVGLPDDGDDATALTFNVPYEGLSDRTAWARARILLASGLNWPYRSTAPVDVVARPLYDPIGDRWIVGGNPLGPSTNPKVYWSDEYGANWTALPNIPNSDTVAAMAVHPTTRRLIALSAKCRAYYLDVTANAWIDAGAYMPGTTSIVNDVHYMPSSKLFVVVGSSFGTHPTHIATSPDGATWTLRDAQIPAANVNVSGWLTAANPTRILALPGSGGVVMTSSDGGIVWSERPALPSGDLMCIGYGDGEFLIAMYSGTIYASTDGMAWTVRSDAPRYIYELQMVQGAWIAWFDLDGSGARVQIRASHDAGKTWRNAGVILPSGGGGQSQFRIGSGGGQGMATNGPTLVASQNVG